MKTGIKILLTIVILVAALALGFILDDSGIGGGNTIGIAFGIAGIAAVWGLLKPKSAQKKELEDKTINVDKNEMSDVLELDFDDWDMVFVEGGSFLSTLGDTTDDGREIVVEKNVNIQSFYIGRYPVTRGQWVSIMEDKLCEENANLPKEGISWEDSQEFIKKLNERTGKKFRLPTATEWEFAASGGNQSKGYQFSGSNNADEVAWYSENSGGHSHEVGTKKPNELGIYDMSGNVWEWCHDRWGGFQKLSTYGGRQQLLMMKRVLTMTGNRAALEDIERKLTEPVVLDEGAYRVRRGCYYGNPTPYMHDSIRFTEVPNARQSGNGFRLAHSVS